MSPPRNTMRRGSESPSTGSCFGEQERRPVVPDRDRQPGLGIETQHERHRAPAHARKERRRKRIGLGHRRQLDRRARIEPESAQEPGAHARPVAEAEVHRPDASGRLAPPHAGAVEADRPAGPAALLLEEAAVRGQAQLQGTQGSKDLRLAAQDEVHARGPESVPAHGLAHLFEDLLERCCTSGLGAVRTLGEPGGEGEKDPDGHPATSLRLFPVSAELPLARSETYGARAAAGDLDLDGDVDLLRCGSLQFAWNVERQLALRLWPRVGKPLVLDAYGTAGALFGAWASLTGASPTANVASTFRLDPTDLVFVGIGTLDPAGRGALTIPVPSQLSIVGQAIDFQALIGFPYRWSGVEPVVLTPR